MRSRPPALVGTSFASVRTASGRGLTRCRAALDPCKRKRRTATRPKFAGCLRFSKSVRRSHRNEPEVCPASGARHSRAPSQRRPQHHRAVAQAEGEIEVVASKVRRAAKTDAKFRLGEGITGRVVQSAKPIVVPRVSREPMFLRRTSDRPELAREEISYVCVPILLNRKAVGALGVDFRFKPERDFDRTVKFLGVVASIVAQAVRIQRVIDAERDRLREENTHLRLELKERYDFSNILGTSGPMRLVYEQVAQVARTDTTVLVRGESGTGKELIAQAIHYNSLRSKRPFIKVSCAALPESLIESELFGYEKGAFTGAQASKKGRFELAEGGTLFLDEIGELNLSTQVKLLRVLQAREFERLGGTKTDSRRTCA